MIVTKEMIIEALKKEPDWIYKLKEYHKELNTHYYGTNLASYLTKITGLENDDQILLRKKYARSNKNLFANLTAPINKIFSAKGGNKTYQLSLDSDQKKFKEYLNQIVNGKSLSKWLHNYWKDKLAVDPNGVFLIEKDKEGNPYPTYKSILSIRDYKQVGQRVDYIIFEPKKQPDDTFLVRVYDDIQDATYLFKENDIVLIEDDTYKNDLGYVPGCLISDLEDTLTGLKKSSIENEIELSKEILRDSSVKTIYKLTHGFPIFWMYYQSCPVCKGVGEIDGSPCKYCNGTGLNLKKDVSDIIGIKPPTSNEDVKITPDIAGYITPPGENLNQMTTELSLLRDMMFFSRWGTTMETGKNETATGRFIDVQPVYDTLNMFADSLEIVETILVDYIGEIIYKEAYKGCSINYGRRFLVETPDQLFDKYVQGKKEKLNTSTLDYMLEQYYSAQFATDYKQMEYYIKLMKLEPFVHMTLSEIPVSYQDTIEYRKKVYFGEWKNTKSIDDIIKIDLKKLDNDLTNYANGKSNGQSAAQI